jgi:hypothetical protein
MILKRKAIKSLSHLKWVSKNYTCVICKNPEVQVCHIRNLPFGNVGLAQKNDAFVTAMCYPHHREQHTMNERKFWTKYKINPIYISYKLACKSPCKKIQKLVTEGYYDEYIFRYFGDDKESSLQPKTLQQS